MNRREVRRLRERVGLSQEGLARAIGYSSRMVREVEAGRRNASRELADKWCAFLSKVGAELERRQGKE